MLSRRINIIGTKKITNTIILKNNKNRTLKLIYQINNILYITNQVLEKL